MDETRQNAHRRGLGHGRFRFGRFVIAGGALAGMVFATLLNDAGINNSAQPMLGTAQSTTNEVPSTEDGELQRPYGPTSAAPAQPDRIGNGSAVDVAIAVATKAFPGGASRVYLARLENPVDALPASALPDGPVLLVPSSGHVPPAVFNAIKALHPTQVVVLGGTAAISEDVKGEIATYTGISNVTRVAGASREATAVEISKLYPGVPSVIYLADSLGSNGAGSPDAVAAGSLTGGPILVARKDGSTNAQVAAAVAASPAAKVVALGGKASVPDAVLNGVASGKGIDRIAGTDRYQTSVAIGKRSFPGGAQNVYLASGSRLEYPLIAGSLTDGPIVLVPNNATTATRDTVTAFGNPYIHAIGGTESVPDQVLQVAGGFAQATPPQENAAVQAETASPTYLKYSQPPSPSDAAKEEAVYNEINAERQRRGLQPMARNAVMDDAARAWAQEVARTSVFEHSHGALKYANLFPPGWKLAGENMVGYYFVEAGPYAQGARQLWVGSPGHLANLANPVYNQTGVGVATGRDWVYCVQNFGQY